MTQKSNTYEVPATMDVRSVDFDPGSSKEIEPDEDVLESEVGVPRELKLEETEELWKSRISFLSL